LQKIINFLACLPQISFKNNLNEKLAHLATAAVDEYEKKNFLNSSPCA
jgi:hypothetical protein